MKYGVEAEKYLKLTNSYHKGIQIFSFGALFFAAYHAHYIEKKTLFAIVILVLLTGLYAIPMLPKSRNLRSLGGLKIFMVAIVWAGATVCLPVIEAKVVFSWDVGIETIQRLLLVLVLLVPFEIRDLKYDSLELKTLPQRLGILRAKYFGISLAILFFLLTFLKDELSWFEILGKGGLELSLIAILLVTNEKQSKYFSSFWVEGLPILWMGALYGLKNF